MSVTLKGATLTLTSIFSEAGEDYRAVLQALGPFNNTHRRLCVEVPFIDDMLCESNPFPEDFTATMVTTNLNVTVTPSKIGVAVDDRFEPECGECV